MPLQQLEDISTQDNNYQFTTTTTTAIITTVNMIAVVIVGLLALSIDTPDQVWLRAHLSKKESLWMVGENFAYHRPDALPITQSTTTYQKKTQLVKNIK